MQNFSSQNSNLKPEQGVVQCNSLIKKSYIIRNSTLFFFFVFFLSKALIFTKNNDALFFQKLIMYNIRKFFK